MTANDVPTTEAGRHGLLATYNKGCRCAECVDIRRAYDRTRYARLYGVKQRIATEAVAAERRRLAGLVEALNPTHRDGDHWPDQRVDGFNESRRAVLALLSDTEPKP